MNKRCSVGGTVWTERKCGPTKKCVVKGRSRTLVCRTPRRARCSTNAQCGCGLCVNKRCRSGNAAWTKGKCGPSKKCVVMGRNRALVCRTLKRTGRSGAKCTTNAHCGCGVCVRMQCRPGNAARTKAKCGSTRMCVVNGRRRALVCHSPRQNKCTKHSQCGCGVCDKVKGTCKAPPASRRTVLCGASGKCIARRGGPAYACVGGISCKAQADCGCGTCYKKRCVVRSRLTRSRCGTSASCVLSGRRLVCKRSKNITARALVAAAAAPAALPFISARSSDATRTAYLAKLRKDIEAAQAIRDAGVAEAEEEAEVVIAEADAEIEEVEEKEAAILVAIGSDDDDDDADDGTDDDAATAATRQALTVGGRTSSDELTLAALEEERKAATAARKAAMRELRAKTRRLRRSVRVTALAGFADMNGLDRQHFLRGEEVLERAEDAADADAEEAAEVAEEAAAATDWAADAVAGTGDEEGA